MAPTAQRTQTKSTSSSAAPAPAPVPTPVQPVAQATEPKKVVRPKKDTSAEVATVAPAAAPAPSVSEPTSSESDSSVQTREDRYKAVLASLDTQLAALKTLRAQVVSNFKADSQDLKLAQKSSGRKRRAPQVVDENAPKKAPSGIVKPTDISPEMCSFMGKPAGTKLARTEVTKFITGYIKQHNLQDSVHKRNINPDAKLKSLLTIPDGEVLTYFNLQKYMKVHFPKPATA